MQFEYFETFEFHINDSHKQHYSNISNSINIKFDIHMQLYDIDYSMKNEINLSIFSEIFSIIVKINEL